MIAQLDLRVLDERVVVCRLPADAPIPGWARGEFVSLTRTRDELSIVCAQENVPAQVQCERDWRIMRVAGPLDFALTGILASLALPLADAGVSIFALSTFDTDYLLVKQNSLDRAIQVLTVAGHRVKSA